MLKKLVQQLSESVLLSYEEVSQRKKHAKAEEEKGLLSINQTRALQLWFDVKLLSNLLPRKEDTPVSLGIPLLCSDRKGTYLFYSSLDRKA